MNFKNLKVPNIPGGGPSNALVKLGIYGGIGLYAVANSLYNVEGGHRAIVFNRVLGVKDKVYPEGTHFMIPWFERPVIYGVRARPHLIESTSGSRDLQMVMREGQTPTNKRTFLNPPASWTREKFQTDSHNRLRPDQVP